MSHDVLRGTSNARVYDVLYSLYRDVCFRSLFRFEQLRYERTA